MSPGQSSDKENANNRGTAKGKGPMAPPSTLPTPTSDEHRTPRANKRRRTEDHDESPSTSQRPAVDGEEDEEETRRDSRYYDPAQDHGERRDVKRKSRALEREFNDNRDDYLKNDNNGLGATIKRANDIFNDVKQTSDATLDSRLMVSVSDLTQRKAQQLVLGDSSTGIDVDEFVSKCLSFMRAGQRPAETATQRRRRSDEDDDDEVDTFLNWERLGTLACFPNNIRPAVPSFLLGPLSVQKRVRATTQRRARLQRDTAGREAQPEQLTKEDMSTNERNSVRHECTKILTILQTHCKDSTAAIESAIDDDTPPDEVAEVLRSHRLTDTGGPSLFDFVINPQSFGQTIENLFYVSFLIKEGEVGVSLDNDGLPTLTPNYESNESARENRQMRYQAVFGMDYQTWQKFIDAYEIKESLIPHREERSTQVGGRGWYG